MSPAKLKLEIKKNWSLENNLNWRGKRAFIQCIATASVEFHDAVKMDLLLNLASALLGKLVECQYVLKRLYRVTLSRTATELGFYYSCDNVWYLGYLWLYKVVKGNKAWFCTSTSSMFPLWFISYLWNENRVSLISTTVEVKFPLTRLSD